MKRLAVVIAVLIAACAVGQKLSDTYGKTNAQIRAMGYDRWYNFYTGKAGESTMGMSDAATLYAAALYDANRKTLAKLKPADRQRVQARTKFGEDFEDAMLDVVSRWGGTMWIPVRARAGIGTEELRAKLIKQAAKPAAGLSKDEHRELHLKLMGVLRNLDALSAHISKDDASQWAPGATKAGLVAEIRKQKQALTALEPQLLKNRYGEAKAVLDALADSSELTRFKDIE